MCLRWSARDGWARLPRFSRSAPKGLDPTTSLLCNSVHVSVDAFWLDSEGRDQPRFARELGELCRATGGLLHCVDLDGLCHRPRPVMRRLDGVIPHSLVDSTQVPARLPSANGTSRASTKSRRACRRRRRGRLQHGPRGDAEDKVFDGSARPANLRRGLFPIEGRAHHFLGARRDDVLRERIWSGFVNFEAGKRIYVQCALLSS